MHHLKQTVHISQLFGSEYIHIISEAPNYNSTFNLMLIVIILSFINSGDMVECVFYA